MRKYLLSLLCLLGLGLSMSMQAAVTVYFQNDKGWANPYIHYWGSTGSTYPGVRMTKVDSTVWKYDCPNGTTGCLFNAGDGDKTKTSDFAVVAGHIYTTSGDQGVYNAGGGSTEPETPPTPSGNTYTVHFTNPNNWTTVNAYVWNGSQNVAAWPGAAATKNGNVWDYTFTASFTPANVIFNNGNDAQTGDMVFKDGATYNMTGEVGVENPTFTCTYVDTENWAQVYCYTFDGVCTGGWPGTKMTKGTGNEWTISFQAAVAPSKVIFSNGNGSQHPADGGFVFETGAKYNKNGKVTGGGDDPVTPPTPGGDSYTVHFTNPKGWTNVSVYVWDEGDNHRNAAWPGDAATKNGNVWDYTFTADWTPAYVIFTDGKASGTAQTGDLLFVNNATYDFNGVEGAVYPTYTCTYVDTENWTKVYCYTYSPEATGGWPGAEMTKGTGNEWTISFQAAVAPTKVIFTNNSGSQHPAEGGFDFENGAKYNKNGKVTEQGGEDPQDPTTYIAYLDNKANWAAPHCYAWTRNGSVDTPVTAAWPGDEMTYNAETKLWSITFTAKPDYVIFNDGNAEDAAKTADMAFVNDKTYESPEAGHVYTIYIDNQSGYAPLYVYGYDINGAVGAEWPGQQAKWDAEAELYTATFASAPTTLIFNNGKNDTDEDAWKKEHAFVDGDTYVVTAEPTVDLPYFLYLYGSFNNWQPTTEYQLQPFDEGGVVVPGVWTISNVKFNEETYFSFAGATGDWDAINASLRINAVTDGEEVECEDMGDDCEEALLKFVTDQPDNAWVIAAGTYDFTVAYTAEMQMIRVIKHADSSEEPGEYPASLWILGTPTSYIYSEKSVEGNNGVYTYEYEVNATKLPFSILFLTTQSPWEQNVVKYAAASDDCPVAAGNSYPVVAGDNLYYWVVSEVGHYVFTLDLNNNTFTVALKGNTDPEPPTPGAYTVYLDNKANWAAPHCYAWMDGGDYVTAGWPGNPMTFDDATNLWSITLDVEPDLVIFNNGEGAQTADDAWVTGKTYTNEVDADVLYVRNSSNNYACTDAFKMTLEDNGTVYVLSGVNLPAGTEFKIANIDWSKNWGGDLTEQGGGWYQAYPDGSNIALASAMVNGTIKFAIDTDSIYIEYTTGVEGIDVDADNEVRYFNLNGVEVMNPTSGLFIVVRGGKASKELVY